jgi:GDP-fucose transporter C1
VTWFQCVVTVAIQVALGELGKRSSRPFLKQFPPFECDLAICRKILPLSLFFVGMTMFNNLCIQMIEVSFYNVARSLTILFNVILMYVFFKESTSPRSLACVMSVFVGFLVGVEGEVNFSLLGTAFGVTSSIFVALNGIYTKKVSGAVNNDKWRLSLYNNLNACVLFPFLSFAFGEAAVISKNSALLVSGYFWFIMVLGGALGFLIGIMTIMQVACPATAGQPGLRMPKPSHPSALRAFCLLPPLCSRPQS